MKGKMLYIGGALIAVLAVQLACQSATPVVERVEQPVVPTNTVISDPVTSTLVPSPVVTNAPTATLGPKKTALPISSPTPRPTSTPRVSVATPASGKAAGYGRIIWNGQPAAEYKVQLCEEFTWSGCKGKQYSVYSNKDGYYVFNNVASGSYVVVIHISKGIWLYKTQFRIAVKEKLDANKITMFEERQVFKFDLNISYPKDGQKISESKPILKWAAYPGAAYYIISLIDKHSYTIIHDVRVDANEYQLEQSLSNCKYRWGLSAFNADGMKIADLYDLNEFTVVNQTLSCGS